MESDLEDTRFLLTCNGKDRIIDAIQSRNPVIEIKYDLKQVIKRIFYILDCENIKLSKENQEAIVKIAHKKFPDIRQLIGIMQNCCITGKFVETAISNDEGINNIVEYIKKNIKNPCIFSSRFFSFLLNLVPFHSRSRRRKSYHLSLKK